jgi:microcystin degradation protein MlrC
VLLDLHGAMVPEGVTTARRHHRGGAPGGGPDADRGDARLPRQPGKDMVAGADLLHGYKTYPHVDMAERGVEAAERLAQVIGGRIKPTAAWRKPPLMPPLGRQGTARGPMRRLYDLAGELERDPKVISISLFAGFPYADIPDAGLGIYVVTDDDKALAERLADQLARVAWEHRTSSSTPRCR